MTTPVSVNEELRHELLAMREEDLRVRAEVVKGSSSFDGYHPRMEEVHKRNAARLKEIIVQHGWPGRSLAGEDGAVAAWFIVQHAISDPAFQRQTLEVLRAAVANGEASAMAVAFLEDRIRVCEGRPQIYGTQFDPDEHGIPQPCQIEDPEHVNQRRLTIGINTIEERTGELQKEHQPEYNPEKRAEYERNYREWLRKVGWRS